jgi:hypothetical protein
MTWWRLSDYAAIEAASAIRLNFGKLECPDRQSGASEPPGGPTSLIANHDPLCRVFHGVVERDAAANRCTTPR